MSPYKTTQERDVYPPTDNDLTQKKQHSSSDMSNANDNPTIGQPFHRFPTDGFLRKFKIGSEVSRITASLHMASEGVKIGVMSYILV